MQAHALFLASYQFVIEYIPGSKLSNADTMSRMTNCDQPTDSVNVLNDKKIPSDNILVITNIYQWTPAT
jgi:hypothetical protein